MIPDYASYCTGWRIWELRECADASRPAIDRPVGPVALISPLFPVPEHWPPRKPMVARCGVSYHHAAPALGCTCGLYAARDRRYVVSLSALHRAEFRVYGQVALWGMVIEHELGWRAQYAYPLELWVPDGLWRYADALRNAYGVPVHPGAFVRLR